MVEIYLENSWESHRKLIEKMNLEKQKNRTSQGQVSAHPSPKEWTRRLHFK